MKTNRAKALSTTALIAVLCMQLFWMWNSLQITVHQMGYETPWNLAPEVRIQALLAAFYESKFTVLTSLLTTVVIIMSLIDQINYIDEQERVRLLREDFSYAMVHDMKSPLTSIIMGTKYLHSGVLEKKPEMKEKYFCIVEDEAQHLLALINRLLTISKLEHGKLHIQKAEVNLETMIEDVVDKYKAKSAKPIHIITRFGATSTLADEEYLKEAISNLVDNATKYSKEDINIEISTLEDDRNVYIKVFDEGIGIAKSELKTIFNRFERAAEHEKDARKTRGGFGIGLNYVLQVINAHGGKISVKSEKDKWSEFTISLPKYFSFISGFFSSTPLCRYLVPMMMEVSGDFMS
jgi:signal transduction histidine kinase